jgi:hypothetical protein
MNMTEDELKALPDVSPEIGYAEVYVGGNLVRIPTTDTKPGAIFQQEDDGMVIDSDGVAWMTGWVNGVRVRRLMHSLFKRR